MSQKPPPKKIPSAAPSVQSGTPAPSAPVKKTPPSQATMISTPKPFGSASTQAQASAPARAGVNRADCIEDAVLALFKDSGSDVPKVFMDFYDRLEPAFALGETSAALLKDFANIDVTAERVAQTLKSNQYYQYHFQRVVASMSRRPEPPPLEAAVVMLGMQNSRNLILALQMQRAVHRSHPEYDKDGKLKLVPKEVLKYALKTEEIHVALKAQYADLGFAAGLVFDYLVALALKYAPDAKKTTLYIDQLYMHCLKSAYVAREIAAQMPSTGFGKFTFSAALLHDIGKAALAILTPEYFTFSDNCIKKELSRPIRMFAEEEQFGVNHAILGAMICHSFQIFRPIERVILHHHEPFLMKDGHRNLQPLASLVALATNVANHFKKVDHENDPVLKHWKTAEIADFGVNLRTVITAVQRVV